VLTGAERCQVEKNLQRFGAQRQKKRKAAIHSRPFPFH
jgi:hypothetical protein